MEHAYVTVLTRKRTMEEKALMMLGDTPAYNLNLIQVHVLHALYEADGQHPTALARAVGKPATSFTPILDSLTDRELVIRMPDKEDRRAVVVHLTKYGAELRSDIQRVVDSLNTEFAEQPEPELAEV